MKIFFRRIHLYLSLAAGLVILTACLTGAILVFEKDLQMSFNKEKATRTKEKKTSKTTKKKEKKEHQGGYTIFINPYNGKILEKYSYRETFFYKVFALHRWLLGGEKSAGKYIVGVSTFIFL